jgi:hypothetical protein
VVTQPGHAPAPPETEEHLTMTRHLGFAPLPYSGGNAGDIELSGWTRATEADLEKDAREQAYRNGLWDTSFECFEYGQTNMGLDTLNVSNGTLPADDAMSMVFSVGSEPVLTFHEDGRAEGGWHLDPDAAATAILDLVTARWGRPFPEHHWAAVRATQAENNTQRITCLPVGHKITDKDGYKLTWNDTIYTLDKAQ